MIPRNLRQGVASHSRRARRLTAILKTASQLNGHSPRREGAEASSKPLTGPELAGITSRLTDISGVLATLDVHGDLAAIKTGLEGVRQILSHQPPPIIAVPPYSGMNGGPPQPGSPETANAAMVQPTLAANEGVT